MLRHNAIWTMAAGVLLGSGAGTSAGQVAATPQGQVAPGVPGLKVDAPPVEGVEVDRVVAVVNGELVLESDVDEERRFGAFQPYRTTASAYSREQAIERLVNRALILQQAKLQQEPPITDAAVKLELDKLRKDIPACKKYKCETDAGWEAFVRDQGFSLSDLTERWRERMEVLRFIEERFRMGIRISDAEIKSYYEKTMLPEYEKEKTSPPKLEAVSDRIQEVLLQQQVGNLLQDWLKSLRASGSVRMATPGEVAP